MFHHIHRILLIQLRQIFTFFRSLQIFLDGEMFTGIKDIKPNLLQYFPQKWQKPF